MGVRDALTLALGFATVAVALTVNVVAVAVAYGKLKQWTLDHEAASERQRTADREADCERWATFTTEAGRRWETVERLVGLSNGGKFMDKGTCAAIHAGLTQQVATLEREVGAVNLRVTEGLLEGRQYAEEGRRDRADLRERVGLVGQRVEHVEGLLEGKQ